MQILVKSAYTDIIVTDLVEPGEDRVKGITDSVTLTVDPTHTIGTVKSMLRSEAWVPEEGRYLLVYDEKPLDDGSSTLDECGIKDRDTILFCRSGSFPIYIYTPSNERHTMHVDCLNTLRCVKEKIQEMTGYLAENQHLFFRHSSLADDERRLLSYGVAKPPREEPGNLPLDMILVTVDGSPHSENHASLDEWITNPNLCHRPAIMAASVAYEMETDEDYEDAYRRGVTAVELGDFSFFRILDSGSDAGKMRIFIDLACPKTTTECATLVVDPKDTIDTVKNMIHQLELHFDVRHVLLFGKKLLVDGSSTLEDCGIKDRDTIQICDRRCFMMFVCPPSPRIGFVTDIGLYIKVVCFDTIRRVKEKIQERTGIHPKRQRLRYRLVWLDDDDSLLMDYGILGTDIQIFDDPVVYLFPTCDEAEGSEPPSKRSRSVENMILSPAIVA